MRPHRSSFFLALALALLLVASGCARGREIDESVLTPKIESSKILAADGSLITTLQQGENREIVPLDQIPLHLRNAVIAIEDARFFSHGGFDAKAILRAALANARSRRVVEGGSTITQQLVRNALEDVGKEKSLKRKLKEADYALRVEETLGKNKILELYLNTVYFGDGAYGVQSAAQSFFGKNAGDLTLAEAALLAGLIKSPVLYNPRSDAQRGLRRRSLVLDRMLDLRLAEAKAVDAAKQADMGLRDRAIAGRFQAPYFVDYVTRQIQHSGEFLALGTSVTERSNRLFRGGLRIYTTLDPKVQSAAEAAVAGVLDQPDKDPSAALAALDPKTGQIKAMVGGRDYFAAPADDVCVRVGAVNDDGSPKTCAKVNLALGRAGGGSGRQSGSAFKPFVLAAALAKGRRLIDTYPAPSCIDIPKADAGRDWHVCNYEEASFGEALSVRDGTVKSVNTVYAQLIMDVGAMETVKTAERMGIGETTRRMGLSDS
ncbi:MAG: transglycosylase domain-containing protein, partial [Actinomycetota bacterium]